MTKDLRSRFSSGCSSPLRQRLQIILASEKYSFEGRSIASRASATGSASHAAVAGLEKAHVGLQEVMDDLEAAARIDWVA